MGKGPDTEPPVNLDTMLDSAASPAEWSKDPAGNTKLIAETFREACTIAQSFGGRLAAEGEICWAGMQAMRWLRHSWRHNVEWLEMVGRPETLGFQAHMTHTMLFTTGYNAPGDRLLAPDFDWSRREVLADAYLTMASALRPGTIDFHVARNDGTVKGAGSHEKTGRHCPPDDPNGKLDLAEDSGANTWNGLLRTIIAVRNAHGD